MKVFINGKDVTIKKDKFKKDIKYSQCTELETKKVFLNIQSLQYFLGKYDLWKSKEGDILNLKDESDNLLEIYEYSNLKYWLIKDYKNEKEILRIFNLKNPGFLKVNIVDSYIIAINDEFENKYIYSKEKNDFIFSLVEKNKTTNQNLDFEDFKNYKIDIIPEINEFEQNFKNSLKKIDKDLPCSLKDDCPFKRNGNCTYFNDVKENYLKLNTKYFKVPCRDPFLFLNEN
jgi:hypothetical protein